MGEDAQSQSNESQGLTAEEKIYHSGKLSDEMIERPVNEFDKTSLSQAHERELITPLPEHPGELNESEQKQAGDESSRNKLALFIGGGLFALAAAGIGYNMGQDKDEVAIPSTTTSEMFNEEVELVPMESTTTELEIEEPISGVSYGNINLSEVYQSGEPSITATRPNGETIRVPKLRSPQDPQAFAESALALIGCYLNTGDEVCLDALTSSQTVKTYWTNFRNTELLNVIEPLNDYHGYDDFQLVIYDESSDPVRFSYNKMDSRVLLNNGTLRMQLSDDKNYQGLEMSSAFYGRTIDSLLFKIDDSQPDEPRVEELNIVFGEAY